ncbi:NADP-dependent malic enzyme [Chondrinema litorale]|uniref:NADP-dependent malic enzyme n=1 Tax=Chondrinema litorale TaxID=2994555 RepID=UPI00254285AA|nr:NADP-dependent malic enzyme [Chondrinema litorale]UZR94957.1 NADP-dependent malic enzyme [Chondrinema litorale]
MAKSKIRREDALEYHKKNSPGKIEVIPTKDSKTQRDLALAYSPGVAFPCLEIAENPETVYEYTAKGNLVAVISDGSAVLGLGNIGPEASKPVMEGKGILFKIFAGIDVFDLELNTKSTEEFISVVKALEPTFGGINLEDIKAPDCFEIESRLKQEMNIPVMHDDQHGTAIISGAALINAVEVVDKKLSEIKVVVSGAGASAISCIKIIIELGVNKENIIVCDSRGVIRADREGLSGFKKVYATERDVNTLEEALKGSDFFLGLSKGNVMSPEMLLSMAENPIVFALANPDPEIDYNLAMETRSDAIMATGRSDFPNQVNNVLGFPFIFRGALDVRATEINEDMKLEAVKAIAALAKAPVPDIVMRAYNQSNISFGRDYIIPKPFDPRLLTTVTPAVAKAAIKSGVAQKEITDWDAYESALVKRMGNDDNVLRVMINRARQKSKKIVFAEADDHRILKAAQIALDEGICEPILLGDAQKIKEIMKTHQIKLEDVEIIDPRSEDSKELIAKYAKSFFNKRKRRGYNWFEAQEKIKGRNYFGTMMVDQGDADALISGISRNYANTIRPALEVIGTYAPGKKVSSMYLMITKKGPLFFADTTIIPNPTEEELVDITKLTAAAVKDKFDIEPRVALLSYSNFGSSDDDEPRRMRKAVEILKETEPDLIVEGEIQANFAFNQEALKENYPFSDLIDNSANVFIFPNLSAANIAYKLLQVMGTAEAVGPILLGMNKPVHILQMGSSVREVLNMISIANIDAQNRE